MRWDCLITVIANHISSTSRSQCNSFPFWRITCWNLMFTFTWMSYNCPHGWGLEIKRSSPKANSVKHLYNFISEQSQRKTAKWMLKSKSIKIHVSKTMVWQIDLKSKTPHTRTTAEPPWKKNGATQSFVFFIGK